MGVKQLNDIASYVNFLPTWQFKRFMRLPHQIVGLFCGNQAMKTSSVTYSFVHRVLGSHPVPKKNVVYFECETRNKDNLAPHGFYAFKDCGVLVRGWEKGTWNLSQLPKDGKCPFCGGKIIVHQRVSRKIRLCSETLPGDKESVSDDGSVSAETKNSVYPELKKWMPNFLIKRDITFRNPAMIIKDPLAGFQLNGTVNRGDAIIFDFVSYSQTIQASASVQRMAILCDEEPPKDFWDEQCRRLLIEDGDITLALTPANQMSWSYDEIFERAQVYYRTKAICDFLNTNEKDKEHFQVETTQSPASIGVVMAATDDNPILSKEAIESNFATVDDPDVLATRRYGIHRQVSGRIFKSFDYKVHYINFEDYFPDGMFEGYNHYRMIDYHPHNKWACCWLSLSPYNEAFVWREYSPDPERLITRTISNEIAILSEYYKYKLNLIDPLAAETQTKTGTTTVDDLNDYFMELRKEGVGTGGYWETWDTKGTRGREVIRARLINSKKCGVPFNNKIVVDGVTRWLPTIWISTACPETARSLKRWRREANLRSSRNIDKEKTEKPAQKFSHYCTAIEAIFKDVRVRPPSLGWERSHTRKPNYFKGYRTQRMVA